MHQHDDLAVGLKSERAVRVEPGRKRRARGAVTVRAEVAENEAIVAHAADRAAHEEDGPRGQDEVWTPGGIKNRDTVSAAHGRELARSSPLRIRRVNRSVRRMPREHGADER